MLAKLAHRAEDGDAPLDFLLGAKALQSGRHRCRIGVVAFVDQQELAAFKPDLVPLASPLEPAEIGQREPRDADVERRALRSSRGRRARSKPNAHRAGKL